MMLVNPSMKEKYPYWYHNEEIREERNRIERLIEEAEYRISKFVDAKLDDVELRIREIENKVNQSSFNIETTLNNQTIDNSSMIKREVKKIVIKELEKALK